MMNKIENFGLISGTSITEESINKYGNLDDAMSLIESFIDSNFIGLDHSKVAGLHDLTIRPSAYVLAAVSSLIKEFDNQRSISAIQNGVDISENIVDSILSNFFISRKQGSRASGFVKISIEDVTSSYRISSSVPFVTSSGLEFFVDEDIYITPSSQKIIIQPGGFGYFFVGVHSSGVGDIYNIAKNTQLIYSSSISGVISCVAESQFSGGMPNEKNEALIKRLKSSISARGMFSSESIKSSILSSIDWVDDVFTCGSSSSLVFRNFFGNFGAKLGGFCDVYVSSGRSLNISDISLLATRHNDSSFLVSVPAASFPGHYDVLGVTDSTMKLVSGGYNIISKRRYIDPGEQRTNKLLDIQDCVYSKYMATEVIFNTGDDVQADVVELSVSVSVLSQGNISEIQALMDSDDSGVVMVDALARSMVPCFVYFDNLVIRKSSGSNVSTPDVLSKIISYIVSCNSIVGIKADSLVSSLLKIENVIGVDLPIVIYGDILLPLEVPKVVTISSMNRLQIEENTEHRIGPGIVRFIPQMEKMRISILEY